MRLLNQAQVQVADRFAELVRRTSQARLEQLMGSPAGRLILEAIFSQMPRRLDGKRAAGTTASVRWRITRGADRPPTVYELELDGGRCRVIRGERGSEARVTITVDGAQFLRIATGGDDPTRAYFSGRISLAGDVMLAARLGTLFVIPGR